MLETLILNHLRSCTELHEYLAEYDNMPAVFYQTAPTDTDGLWSKEQYARIIFYLNIQDDPERVVSGSLAIELIAKAGSYPIEKVERLIREAVDGYFFTAENRTMAVNWNTSDYFSVPTDKTHGTTIAFDLLAFPHQETVDPDPIGLINEFSKDFIPEAYVIGMDDTPEIFKPDNENPAIYWRQTAINPCGWIPDTYACSWHTAVLNGHIFADDKDIEASIARDIDNALTIKKRLIFDDNSPLMVDRNIRLNLTADALRTGQITVDATYGILNIPKRGPLLENIHTNGRRVPNGSKKRD
ncbi:MAG: hypothetical protein HFE90_09285 [Firmicutes bacterium]|nr:hypothetical protein [Bacillota bacterium]